MRQTYRCVDCDTTVTADLVEASAPIYYVGDDGPAPSPYQTADCRHRASELHALVGEPGCTGTMESP